MSRNKSLLGADPASLKILEAAFASPKGIELIFPTKGTAEARRFSIYHARKVLRRRNPPNYTCQYDDMQCHLSPVGDHWKLQISRGWLDPAIVIREVGTGREINLDDIPLNALPQSQIAQLPGLADLDLAPTTARPAITAEQMAEHSLHSDATMSNAQIEELVKSQCKNEAERIAARTQLQTNRREAWIKLGWCAECGAQEGQEHKSTCPNGNPLAGMEVPNG